MIIGYIEIPEDYWEVSIECEYQKGSRNTDQHFPIHDEKAVEVTLKALKIIKLIHL